MPPCLPLLCHYALYIHILYIYNYIIIYISLSLTISWFPNIGESQNHGGSILTGSNLGWFGGTPILGNLLESTCWIVLASPRPSPHTSVTLHAVQQLQETGRTIATFHPQIASGHCRCSFLGASRRLEPCWKNEPPFLRRWFCATTCVQPQSFSTWKVLTLGHLDLSYPDPRHLISSLSFGVFFPNWMTISLGGWRLPEIHRIACGTAICCVVSMRVFRKLRACKILILPASHGIVAPT